MFLDQALFGLASAGLNIGMNIAQSEQAYNQAKRRQVAERRQRQLARANANLQIREQNARRLELYNHKLQVHEQNLGFIRDAANRAFVGTQVDYNRQLASLAFQRNNRQQQVLETLGASRAAGEGRGRSYDLQQAKRISGRAGVMEAQENMQRQDLKENTMRKLEGFSRQAYQSAIQSYNTVAITPYLQRELPPAATIPGPQPPSFLSNALMIGQGLMGGYQAALSVAPT